MRVLLAEDEQISATLVSKVLKKLGYDVMHVINGDDAWKVLCKEDSPRIAILDWVMPGIEGPELCRRIKAMNRGAPIHTIILTSKTDKRDLVFALDAGADDYISKPFNIEELRVRVRAAERIVNAHDRIVALNATLEERIRDRTNQLQDALKVAEQASMAKSSFLANMSHEIRTPLNGIVSYVELLLLSSLEDEQREDLLTIKTCVDSLRLIINNVLDFSKIEADRMVIESAEFSLRSVIEETTTLLKHKATEDEKVFVVHIDENIPEKVLGDRVRVQQILINLLGNAIKFCSHGGAILLYAVTKRTDDEFVHVEFSISDTGIGIAVDQQSKLFSAFTQADPSTTRTYGGTGLGLAITKRLTELMQGRIWFESREGVGTAFHVALPFAIPDNQTKGATEIKASELSTTPVRGGGRRILLAEDNEVNLAAVTRILEANGFSVTKSRNGQEVIDSLSQSQFDLVLLDIQMPVMGGEEALVKIRGDPQLSSSAPIIALSANAVAGDRARFLSQGFNDYVSKPIDYPALFRTIDTHAPLDKNSA